MVGSCQFCRFSTDGEHNAVCGYYYTKYKLDDNDYRDVPCTSRYCPMLRGDAYESAKKELNDEGN